MNGKGLPSIHIIPATEFYDYEAKYNRDDTVYQCPSEDLSEAEENLMRELAVMWRAGDWCGRLFARGLPERYGR